MILIDHVALMEKLLNKAKVISEELNSLIYLNENEAFGRPVIIKVLKKELVSNEQLTQLLNEYDTTKNLDSPYIRKPISKTKISNKHALVLEYINGSTLKDKIKGNNLTLGEKLKIAVDLCEAISSLHHHHIVHKNLSSYNTIVTPTNQVRLIDFGISTSSNKKKEQPNGINYLENNLEYIAPEQTGRVAALIDNRSDLYSMGVILYEVFTSHLPFKAENPLELIQQHIAMKPSPPHLLSPQVPIMISKIILKLLEKSAHKRYQSAYSVKKDLLTIIKSLETGVLNDDFELAKGDHSGKFFRTHRLFGRDHEYHKLMTAFDGVAKGSKEFVLIAGYSGTGKTFLVKELKKPVTALKGNFLEGTFKIEHQDKPFYGFIKAFEAYIDNLLTKEPDILSEWNTLLNETFDNKHLLSQLIPNLELVVGDTAPVKNIAYENEIPKIIQAFSKLIGTLANRAHPLILFLDDLTFADTESLQLLRHLSKDTNIHHTLIICTYRDNELGNHPDLIETVQHINTQQLPSHELFLKNLGEDEISGIIATTLNADLEAVAALSKSLFDKTYGNPQQTLHLLKALRDQNLLHYSPNGGNLKNAWNWSIDEIQNFGYSNNVIELLIQKVTSFHSSTLDILKLASCLGNRFHSAYLFDISRKNREAVRSALIHCVNAGLIVQISKKEIADKEYLLNDITYRFIHDKIQQAIYSLLDETEKAELHFNIAQYFQEQPDVQNKNLYTITDHFNAALAHPKQKRENLLLLNIQSGHKAKNGANKIALKYYQRACQFILEEDWETGFDRMYQFYEAAAETAFLAAEYDVMDAFIGPCIERAKDSNQKVEVLITRIKSLVARNQLLDAVKIGMDLLWELGLKFKANPSKTEVVLAVIRTELSIKIKGIDSLRDLPLMTNPTSKNIVKIIASFGSLVYRSNPKLFTILLLKSVRICLNEGISKDAILALTGYGIIQCGALDNAVQGFQIGSVAHELIKKLGDKSISSRSKFVLATFVYVWTLPIKDSLEVLKEAYYHALETGDNEYASSALFIYGMHSFYLGKELLNLENDLGEFGERIKERNQYLLLERNQLFQQTVQNLIHSKKDNTKLIGEAFDERSVLNPKSSEQNLLDFYLFTNKLYLSYLFGKNNYAVKYANTIQDQNKQRMSSIMVAFFHQYRTLAYLETYQAQNVKEKKRRLKLIHTSIKKFTKWSKNSDANFHHKLLLLKAQKQRVFNQLSEASKTIETVISLCKENKYYNDLALALELASKIACENNQTTESNLLIQQAHKAYQRWGALSKAQQLEKLHPSIIKRYDQPRKKDGSQVSEINLYELSKINLKEVIKASSAISNGLTLLQVQKTILAVVKEITAAANAVFVLNKEEKLCINTSILGEEENIYHEIDIHQELLVPNSIIKFVLRSKTSFSTANIAHDNRFKNDPYFKNKNDLSLFCFPIIKLGTVTGIVYLESSVNSTAFTSEQKEFIGLISGQMATSLDNSLLYNQMEKKIRKRTFELKEQQEKLQSKNKKLIELNNDKDNLISIVSHDLRSPLNQIKGLAGLVKMQYNKEQENMDMIIGSTDRLCQMINRILDVNGLENGFTTLNEDVVNINTLISKVRNDYKITANIKNITIKTFNRCAKQTLLTDLSFLQLALDNLVSNALKFSPSDEEISIGAFEKDGKIVFEVSDNGQGIDTSEINLLFKKFQKLSSKPTGNEASTGLGLSIVKKYVEAMGGRTWCESTVGEGASFYIEI